MADGDNFTPGRTLAKYVANDGKEYKRKVPTGYYEQAGLGWTAGDPADSTLPKGIRLRHATLRTAGGVHRKVIVATNAALAAMVPGTTTIIANVAGNQLSMIVNALEGEHSLGQG